MRALASELAHYDGAAELDHGLDALLTGLCPANLQEAKGLEKPLEDHPRSWRNLSKDENGPR